MTSLFALHKSKRLLSTTVLLLALSFQAQGADTYTPANNQLAIPLMAITGASFAGVVVTAGTILNVAGGTPYGSVDLYTPASNQLFIPSVVVGGTTYSNVTITVGRLVSIGSVTSSDNSYSAPNLTIPAVQLNGGPIYSGIEITVGSIVSTGGGMPTVPLDSYDTTTRHLTIPAIQLGSTIYTNATITVGKLVSNGGALPPESVLYSFSGAGGARGSLDGALPNGLIQGKDGYFYGTTQYGGAYDQGAVVKLTAAGAETVLYSFSGNGGVSGSTDGARPLGRLVQGSDGNLYGTTSLGGTKSLGTVFRITLQGVETVLHSFLGTPDGAEPMAGLIQGTNGNYYGTTSLGGLNGVGGATGQGTVFEMTAEGIVQVLLSFSGNGGTGSVIDGSLPRAPLILGSDGNYYGTTSIGGSGGGGTVFRMTPAGAETVLYSFTGNNSGSSGDGTEVLGPVIEGSNGHFYGTSKFGGAYGVGTVFEVTPSGTETVLYSFSGGGGLKGSTDGSEPHAGLFLGKDGNFYGVTSGGGAHSYNGSTYDQTGVFFRVTPSGSETVLYSFGASSADGVYAATDLIQGSNGDLYGTTTDGGEYRNGAFFNLTSVIPAQ